MKDYLEFENARNKSGAVLFEQLLRTAFGDCQVMVGHHIGMEFGGDLQTENEIPSADTLIFDHDIMKAVFGIHAMAVMQELATRPCSEREHYLADMLAEHRRAA